MRFTSYPGRVIETRAGRYAVAVIPLLHSEIPGFHATHIQAVRDGDPSHAVRLTLFERLVPLPDPGDGARAA